MARPPRYERASSDLVRPQREVAMREDPAMRKDCLDVASQLVTYGVVDLARSFNPVPRVKYGTTHRYITDDEHKIINNKFEKKYLKISDYHNVRRLTKQTGIKHYYAIWIIGTIDEPIRICPAGIVTKMYDLDVSGDMDKAFRSLPPMKCQMPKCEFKANDAFSFEFGLIFVAKYMAFLLVCLPVCHSVTCNKLGYTVALKVKPHPYLNALQCMGCKAYSNICSPCANCQTVAYCSERCCKEDWLLHCKECGERRKEFGLECMAVGNPCNRCGSITGTSRCRGCLKVSYCGIKCQKDDWKVHKTTCKKRREATKNLFNDVD